jgi:hypothetical protein
MTIGAPICGQSYTVDGIRPHEAVKRSKKLAAMFFLGQIGCDAWIALSVTQAGLLHLSASI